MEGSEYTGGKPWHRRTFPINPLRPAVQETVSCRKTWHPLIMLSCPKQMQKWTWKNVEGTQCESIRKQREDRNSGANRTVGANRISTLPGRQSHLTSDVWHWGEWCTARGFSLAWGFWLASFPRQGSTASAGRRRERCREKTGEGWTGRLWQQRTGPPDNRSRQLTLKSGLGKLHSILSALKTTIYTIVQNKQTSSSCLKFVNLFS